MSANWPAEVPDVAIQDRVTRPPSSEDELPRRLSGAQIIVEYLVRHGVPYAVGIPGHGSWNLTDEVRTVQVMHEQSAVHLADGFYRVSGKPLLAFTSIGPGAANAVVGMATAYVDSTAVLLMTGSAHTYLRGHALLQEVGRRHHRERVRPADGPRRALGRSGRHDLDGQGGYRRDARARCPDHRGHGFD